MLSLVWYLQILSLIVGVQCRFFAVIRFEFERFYVCELMFFSIAVAIADMPVGRPPHSS